MYRLVLKNTPSINVGPQYIGGLSGKDLREVKVRMYDPPCSVLQKALFHGRILREVKVLKCAQSFVPIFSAHHW